MQETSFEPLEPSNVSASGISLPKIDKEVMMIALYHKSFLSVTRSAISNPNKSYYTFNTHDHRITLIFNDDLGGNYDFFLWGKKKYLSKQDFDDHHDVEYLLNLMDGKMPNYAMKIKNINTHNNIDLPNGQHITIMKDDDDYVIIFDTMDLESGNNIRVIERILEKDIKNEIWIAIHYEQLSMTKNARNLLK